jgi:hypothetical protein
MTSTIVAIDPGASGGIAWNRRDGEIFNEYCEPMPATEGDLIALIKRLYECDGPTVFYVESLVKFAGNAGTASGMAVYASNWGFLKGAIMYSGCQLNLVNASTWAKSLGLGIRGKMTKVQWKNKLKSRAQELYPSLAVSLKTADALLLLTYAVRDQAAKTQKAL